MEYDKIRWIFQDSLSCNPQTSSSSVAVLMFNMNAEPTKSSFQIGLGIILFSKLDYLKSITQINILL